MDSLIYLFDSLLVLIVSFPITIFNILVFPHKAFGTAASELTSSPGATFAMSFAVWYFLYHSVRNRILVGPDKEPDKKPLSISKTTFAIFCVTIIFSLIAQFLILLIPSLLPSPPDDVLETVKALSYPMSVALTFQGLVYILHLLFPLGSRPDGLTFEERGDRVMYKIRKKSGRKRIVIEENASFLALLFSIGTYIQALFNTIRAFFELSAIQAIIPTIALLICLILFLVLFLVVTGKFILEPDGDLFTRLRSQVRPMPDKKEEKDQ